MNSYIERLLDVKIDASDFATFERFLPEPVLRDPVSYIEEVRVRDGDMLEIENAQIGGVPFPALTTADGERKVYLACGYDTVRKLVGMPTAFYQDYSDSMDILMGERQLAGLNPPLHKKYRALVTGAFNMQSLEKISGELIEPLVNALVAEAADKDRVELVQGLAVRLPILLIGHIFGLPIDQYGRFAQLASQVMTGLTDFENGLIGSEKLKDLLVEIIEERKENPGEDLISKLIQSEVDGEKLSDDDIISTCRALVPAGIETTTRALSTLMSVILDYPDQMDQVRQNPDLVPQAIDELLRWNGPAPIVPKRTTEEIDFAGKTIPADSRIFVYLGHANRDARNWESPEQYRLDRPRKHHLAFSAGAHLCIGNQLARRELEVSLKALLEKLPGLRTDPEAPEHPVVGFSFRSCDNVCALT